MALWIFAGLVSGFIKGLCGVGDAPVFAAIMSFAHNNVDISPVSLLPSFPINLYMTWQNRRSLQRNIWLPMGLLLVAGCIPGTLLLKNADTGTLKMIFGIFITLVGILMLHNELTHRKVTPSRILLIFIGILAGLCSGLFGVGILLAVYVSMSTDDMSAFKGNICAIFAFENVARLIMYACLGLFTPLVFRRALLVTPFILIGLFCGQKASQFLDESKAKIAVDVVMIISGLAILITNL